MKNTNPILIPRNHKVEEALTSATEGNLDNLFKLLSILINPYSDIKNINEFQFPSLNYDYQTFCGT